MKLMITGVAFILELTVRMQALIESGDV